eukprot:gnl/Chilomastix_caulleri/1482.p3 GENE.gnl/Chilomastix_caulleri/1482~~gnl/Chilomastix_caulleri/1482.p3  ORF type:complete len:119 (+),score=31.95 gnl/Chilomastix_caulleri/1482:552-908(+)
MYIGMQETYKEKDTEIFKTINIIKNEDPFIHNKEPKGQTSQEKERRENKTILQTREQIVLRNARGEVKMPVWGHTFMTPQWLQIWIIIFLCGGLVIWGLITSMKIPTPTNIPETVEQV